MAYSQTQKAPQFWTGEDCRTWAVSVCEKHYFSQFDVNLNAFEDISGQQLLACSQQDIVNLLGHQYAQLFYKEIQILKTTHWEVSGNGALNSNSAISGISVSSLDDTYGFSNSSGATSYQSNYNSTCQPHMLSTEPSQNTNYILPGMSSTAKMQHTHTTQNTYDPSQNTNYILPGLRSTAQMQHTYTPQDTYMSQAPFDPMFTQEQLQDLQTIDETIIEDLSKYLQASNITESTSGYSETNSNFYPSENSNFNDTKYSILDTANVPDMYNTSVSTSNTMSTDQSLFGATGYSYDNVHNSYGGGYDDSFPSNEDPYNADQYDYSLLQDIKPNLVDQEESYIVPEMNVTNSQEEHNCLYDPIQNPNRKNRKRGPKVWEFVLRCLLDSRYNPSLLCWENQSTATFRIVQPEQVARLWGARTGKPDLSYENFSRSLRYHYKQGMLEGLSDRQLVYRFTAQALQAFTRNKTVHS